MRSHLVLAACMQAWDPTGTPNAFQINACENAATVAAMEAVGIPVVVGEW